MTAPRNDPAGPITTVLVSAVALAAVLLAGVRGAYRLAGWLQHGHLPDLRAVPLTRFLHALAQHPTDPGLGLPAATRPDSPSPIVFLTVIAVLLLMLLAVVVVVAHLWFRHTATRDTGPAGAAGAGWATRADLRTLTAQGPQAGRIVLGTSTGTGGPPAPRARPGRRVMASLPEQSILVLGPTRSGKTSRIAVPAIRDWTGPAIVVSTKTDLTLATHPHRQQRGDIAVFDPTGVTGLPTAGWTPLLAATDPREARRVADRFVRVAGTTDGMGSAFWTATAGQLLAPLLHAAAAHDLTMSEVARWVRIGDLTQPATLLTDLGATEMAEAVTAVAKQDPRLRDSTLATLRTVLSAYDDTTLTSHDSPEITVEWLLSGANTLYLVGSSDDQRRLAAVFLALLGEMLDATYRRTEALRRETGRPEVRLDPPLLLVLDEAANMAPLPDLATLASTAGGMGVQLLSLFQDRSQLRRIYGHDAAESISNAHTGKLVLGGITDTDTLTYLSRLLGDRDSERRSRVTGDGPTRVQTQTVTAPLRTPDQLRRLAPGQALYLSGANAPTTLQLARVS